MVRDGRGGVPDTVRATALFAAAQSQATAGCAQGRIGDCDELAELYWGVKTWAQDTVTAMKYRFRSCELALVDPDNRGDLPCLSLLRSFERDVVTQSVASRAEPATVETVRGLLRKPYFKQQCGGQVYRVACDRMKRLYKK